MGDKIGSVLVVGAGVAGLRSAFDLAESGYRVYLIDSSFYMGGTLSQLDRQFPTNRCCMCQMLPTLARQDKAHYCVRREITHPNIEQFPGTLIESFSGESGNFNVKLKTMARWVIDELCIDCGLCPAVCPVEKHDEYNEGLTSRKAIYKKNPLPVPNIYTIDREICNKCGECVKACPTGAIDLNQQDQELEIQVGAVIVTCGFEEFDPALMMQYGHSRYKNILTSIQFERMFSELGPNRGEVKRPSDGNTPRRVAFLQCIGSRDMKRRYCSMACCMYALKEAMVVKEKYPDMEIDFMYMDLRAFGKGYYRYFEEARDKYGIRFIRSRVPVLKEDPGTKNILLSYLDDSSKIQKNEYDLAVLSIGQRPPAKMGELASVLGVGLNEWGFFVASEQGYVKTNKPGIFVCGAIAEPKDIPETITQSSAAACEVSLLLVSHGFSKIVPENGRTKADTVEKEDADAKSSDEDDKIKIGIFICKCGGVISEVVDTGELVKFGAGLRDVVHSEEVNALCIPESLREMSLSIKKAHVNRIVVGACVPYRYLRLFRTALIDAGVNPAFLELVNLREHVALPHRGEAGAIVKAKNMLAMGVERIKRQNIQEVSAVNVVPRALVIGGGVCGMTAALKLALLGKEVDLVEKSERLGGLLNETAVVPYSMDKDTFLKTLVDDVRNSDRIQVYFDTQVRKLEGEAGNFRVVLRRNNGESITPEYGAIIVATGGNYNNPQSFLHGKNPRVLTQNEFENKILSGEIKPETLKNVVMIQCVESRNEQRRYCSRICCAESLMLAIKLKDKNPDIEIHIFNRDIMTYGFRESLYFEAREKRVNFYRYEPDKSPEIREDGEKLSVKGDDPVLVAPVMLDTDYVIVSQGFVPSDNRDLASIMDLELDEDGYFHEAEVKFRPVDFHTDGIFVCGLAHSPRFLNEALVQASACAQRAASVLSNIQIKSAENVAFVNQRRCSGCEVCIAACTYNARYRDEETRTVKVREVLCQGCGMCAMVCPNHASKLRGLEDKQVLPMLEAVLKNV